ncbi:MAG: hypothetical protein ACRDMX_05290 [Solirubrobacteraceae bacterium]
MSPRRFAAASIVAAALLAASPAADASAASARTVTMHFFSRLVYSRVSDSTGMRLPAHTAPSVTDRVSYASVDYVGSHKRHAKRATTSDTTNCILASSTSALCNGAFAVGGAMIIADDFVLQFPSTQRVTTIKITGGTGRFLRARGTITATPAGADLDVIVKVTTSPPTKRGHRG